MKIVVIHAAMFVNIVINIGLLQIFKYKKAKKHLT